MMTTEKPRKNLTRTGIFSFLQMSAPKNTGIIKKSNPKPPIPAAETITKQTKPEIKNLFSEEFFQTIFMQAGGGAYLTCYTSPINHDFTWIMGMLAPSEIRMVKEMKTLADQTEKK